MESRSAPPHLAHLCTACPPISPTIIRYRSPLVSARRPRFPRQDSPAFFFVRENPRWNLRAERSFGMQRLSKCPFPGLSVAILHLLLFARFALIDITDTRDSEAEYRLS